MKKVVFILLTLLMGVLTVVAQDILYLKNGSVIKGNLMEQTSDVLKFQTNDGSVYVYQMSEIERIVREQPTSNYTSTSSNSYDDDETDSDDYLERGFRGLLDIGELTGFGDAGRDNYQVQAAFTGGFQINKMLFVGAGVAPTLNLYNNDYYDEIKASFWLPVYTAARVDILNKKITPFAEARIGYYINTDNTDASGFYFNTNAGVRLNKISLSLGYTYYGNGDYDPANFIGFRFGVEF